VNENHSVYIAGQKCDREGLLRGRRSANDSKARRRGQTGRRALRQHKERAKLGS
jgi:hypothetical protein